MQFFASVPGEAPGGSVWGGLQGGSGRLRGLRGAPGEAPGAVRVGVPVASHCFPWLKLSEVFLTCKNLSEVV